MLIDDWKFILYQDEFLPILISSVVYGNAGRHASSEMGNLSLLKEILLPCRWISQRIREQGTQRKEKIDPSAEGEIINQELGSLWVRRNNLGEDNNTLSSKDLGPVVNGCSREQRIRYGILIVIYLVKREASSPVSFQVVQYAMY